MAKTVAFDVDARQSLKRGIDIVAESVRITLGPKGRNVVLEKKFGAPTMINEGFRNVAAGANPMQIKVGIERAVEAVVEEIKRVAVPVKGHEDVAHVAAISSQDDKIGELIAEAMDKVGKDGVITVEDGQGVGTELETVEGMQFDRGYISPYMVTNPDRMEAVLEDPFILITDRKISAVQDLLPVLEKVVQQGRPLLIVAED